MDVCEESHCGIVPMNHSNKDGTSSAESEEGRLRIKESAGQSNTCPTQSGEACVSQGLSGVRTSGSLGRYSSEIRTGCANERPSGSVRGAPGDWCPYRDRQPSVLCGLVSPEQARTILVQASAFALKLGEDIGHIRVGRTLPSLLRAACERPCDQDWARSNCTPHIPKLQRCYFPARVFSGHGIRCHVRSARAERRYLYTRRQLIRCFL